MAWPLCQFIYSILLRISRLLYIHTARMYMACSYFDAQSFRVRYNQGKCQINQRCRWGRILAWVRHSHVEANNAAGNWGNGNDSLSCANLSWIITFIKIMSNAVPQVRKSSLCGVACSCLRPSWPLQAFPTYLSLSWDYLTCYINVFVVVDFVIVVPAYSIQ